MAIVELAGPRQAHDLFLAHRADRHLPPGALAFLEHTRAVPRRGGV